MATVAIELTGCQRAAALVVGEQNRRHGDRLGDRTRDAPAAEAFGGHHQVDRIGADAVELLGHRPAP